MTWAVTGYCISLSLLALWAFFNTRLDGYRKWVFIPMFLSLMGFAIVGFVQSLGYPLPLWAQIVKKDINVTSFIIDEPHNIIYVWGYLEGEIAPISLEMEFSKKIAEQLVNAKEAEGEEGNTEYNGIVGRLVEGNLEFQPAPPIRLEQKESD